MDSKFHEVVKSWLARGLEVKEEENRQQEQESWVDNARNLSQTIDSHQE